MLYQLRNGKTIEISVEQYLRMSDQELDSYTGNNVGQELNHPFSLSVLRHGEKPSKTDFVSIFEEEVVDDFAEESIEDLTDIEIDEKFADEDFIDFDNIEQ
jgi:hypothetical protein